MAIDVAMRKIQFAVTQAIGLLSALDRARAQLSCLQHGETGEAVDIPGNALALNAAVEDACREVRQTER